jgi:predicted permease
MIHDFRFAFRQLIKAPGFTFAAVLVLGLGIGANTAVFSLVYTMLFAPPAYARPNELVQVYSQDTKNPKHFRAFSYPTLNDLREQTSVFSGVAAHNVALVGIGEKENTRRSFADIVTANYFEVLGVAPVIGRGFTLEEETPGHAALVAVVSYAYWGRHNFDRALLGSEIKINGRPYTIVGVLPQKFAGTLSVVSPEVWVPLSAYQFVMNDYADTGSEHESLMKRSSEQLMPIARFRPGVTAQSAEPALKTLAHNLEQAYPVEQKDQTFITRPLSRFDISDGPADSDEITAIGPLLMSMAGVVLLVACLNLANMLLARGTARRKEIAIRLALGAKRSRIVRQLLSEGFLLSLVGGVAGLALGLWSSDLLTSSMRKLMPLDLVWSSGPNPAILLATFAFCSLGTLAFALGPALKLSRSTVLADLKEHAGEDVTRRRWRFLPRNPLVTAQIAFSLALLTAAALFIRGANKAAAIDTGLHVDQNMLLEVDASLGGLDQQRGQAIYRTLNDRLAAIPGVQHVSISATAPFGMVSLGRAIQRGGVHVGKDDKPATAEQGLAFSARYTSIGAEYFTTVGLPLLRGRGFTPIEATQPGKGTAIAVIDEALAKKLWPNGDALGQIIQVAPDYAPRAKRDSNSDMGINSNGATSIKPEEPIEVVGIAGNSRSNLFEKEPRGTIYVPFGRGFQNNVYFFVQFATLNKANTANAADLIRRAVRETDPALPILSLKTFQQHLDANMGLWIVRTGATLFSAFGILALVLAVVGVYGVKAYSVARRTREIGIRMAVGAAPNAVQWMIMREGAFMLAGGVAVGLLLAIATGKLLSGMLYRVGPLDPLAFTTAPLVLAAATLLATWLPARRATRINPITALRTE